MIFLEYNLLTDRPPNYHPTHRIKGKVEECIFT